MESLNQNPGPNPQNLYYGNQNQLPKKKHLGIIVLIIAVLILGGFIYLQSRPKVQTGEGLTEAQKLQILADLEANYTGPDLTAEQKTEILNSVQSSSTNPRVTAMTAEEKVALLNEISQQN